MSFMCRWSLMLSLHRSTSERCHLLRQRTLVTRINRPVQLELLLETVLWIDFEDASTRRPSADAPNRINCHSVQAVVLMRKRKTCFFHFSWTLHANRSRWYPYTATTRVISSVTFDLNSHTYFEHLHVERRRQRILPYWCSSLLWTVRVSEAN